MHDFEEPTEPMSQVFLPPYSAPTFQTGISTEPYAIPTPELDEVPFPKSRANPVDVSGLSAIPPMYPILQPATPEGRNGRPSGVAPPMHTGKPDALVQPQTRRSSFPALVGLFFLAVEFLLLVRLLFFLFGAPISIVCAIFVYGFLSRILVRFFKALLNSH